MAAQGTEIDKKLLMKIYVIAFMVMKDGKRFLNLLETFNQTKPPILEADFLYWYVTICFHYICMHP